MHGRRQHQETSGYGGGVLEVRKHAIDFALLHKAANNKIAGQSKVSQGVILSCVAL